MLPVMEGACEVLLYQFLSNPDFDHPFAGYTSPVPAWEDMECLASLIVEKVPSVVLVGEKGRKIVGKE
jgi:pyruvate formate lyase activating enzyme